MAPLARLQNAARHFRQATDPATQVVQPLRSRTEDGALGLNPDRAGLRSSQAPAFLRLSKREFPARYSQPGARGERSLPLPRKEIDKQKVTSSLPANTRHSRCEAEGVLS